MKFNFTIRGLFLLTTFVSVLVGIGLWISESPILVAAVLYLLLYLGLFFVLYVYRYRHQIRDARRAWNEHKIARAVLNEEVARHQATQIEPIIEQPLGEES